MSRNGGEDRPSPESPLILVAANAAWNLLHFRSGLIRALIAQGFRVVAVAPPDAAAERQLRAMGCGFVSAPVDPAGLSPRRDLRTIGSYVRIFRQLRPAAWLSWTIKPNIYGSLAARLAGVPAFPNVSGLGTAFLGRRLLAAAARVLYRVGFARARTVFFQNGDDRDLFLRHRLVRSAQADLLPGSGVDLDHFRSPSDERPRPRQFLMVARVVADKGVREYAAAAAAIRARWPDSRFRLLGVLGAANRTAIAPEEVRRWEEEGAVEFVPAVEDVRPFLAEADFVVLPSYREGLSRVLLEAAAMGRPIVTTDVPGCRDVVTDGVNGFLCQPRDSSSLTAALERAAQVGDAEWRRMAAAGRALAVARFSVERVCEQYLQALREGAGLRPGTRRRAASVPL